MLVFVLSIACKLVFHSNLAACACFHMGSLLLRPLAFCTFQPPIVSIPSGESECTERVYKSLTGTSRSQIANVVSTTKVMLGSPCPWLAHRTKTVDICQQLPAHLPADLPDITKVREVRCAGASTSNWLPATSRGKFSAESDRRQQCASPLLLIRVVRQCEHLAHHETLSSVKVYVFSAIAHDLVQDICIVTKPHRGKFP